MHKQGGFSLVELLIVVATIMVISAIAIPNMLRARINANETSAIGSLRTINTAELTYLTTYTAYSPDLPTLGGSSCTSPASTSACIIDDTLANARGFPRPRPAIISRTRSMPTSDTPCLAIPPIGITAAPGAFIPIQPVLSASMRQTKPHW